MCCEYSGSLPCMGDDDVDVGSWWMSLPVESDRESGNERNIRFNVVLSNAVCVGTSGDIGVIGSGGGGHSGEFDECDFLGGDMGDLSPLILVSSTLPRRCDGSTSRTSLIR